MKLILGSSSRYRKKLLENAGYHFDVVVPHIDEKSIKTENPYDRPLMLARAKAEVILPLIKEPSIVITSDIVVVGEGKLYEKPETEAEAREMLNKYSDGLAPETVCAIVVTNTETKESFEGVDISKVFFKPFTGLMIEEFVKEGNPLDCAGGFAIQHPTIQPYIHKIEGTEESIAGLPLNLLKSLLTKAGYSK